MMMMMMSLRNLTKGSRDSFANHYHGSFPIVLVPEVPNISGTELRNNPKEPADDKSFRQGLIEAQRLRYPVSFQTVDIGVIKHESQEILLGRKKTDPEGLWRLPGGFVDPSDSSLESAAARELREEVGNIMTHEITYLGSSKVEDHRYRNESDKIMTALFLTYYMGGRVAASDDLEEVAWLLLEKVLERVIPEHKVLVEKIIEANKRR
jgi:bifunctional NMN adenylyltransferase/nudix hydrolase